MASEEEEFDTAAAAYWWLVQNPDEKAYCVLSRLLEVFTPSPNVARGRLSGAAKFIYNGFRNEEDVNNALHDAGVF